MNLESLFGVDLSGSIALPSWLVAASALLLVLFLFLSLFRAGPANTLGTLLWIGAVGFGVWATWTFLERSAERDHAAERRALDAREIELTSRAVVPGSALACLDGLTGETTESACEAAIFASPESVAAAASYVSARLALYADSLEFANRRDASYAGSIAALRRSLEADRFGIVAHVLATRDGCTADRCEAMALLRDPNRIRANLSGRTFEIVVARHVANWPARQRSTAVPPNGPAAPVGSGAATLSFPSSASIPPVSIMTAEPPAPQAAPPPPTAAAPARRPAAGQAQPQAQQQPAQSRPAAQAAQPRPAPPVQLVPPPRAQ